MSRMLFPYGEIFERDLNGPMGLRFVSLHNEVFHLNQGAMSITGYYTRLKYLWQELDIMTPSIPSSDGIREYVDYLQQQKLYKFLSGLTETYCHVRTQILLMVPLPSLNQAFAILVEEEQRQSGGAFSVNHNQDQIVFAAGKQHQTLQQNQYMPTSASFSKVKRDYNIICDYCHKAGHEKAECYKLVGFPPNFKRGRGRGQFIASSCTEVSIGTPEVKIIDQATSEKGSSGRIFSEEQYQKILKLIDRDTVGGAQETMNFAGLYWEGEPDW